MRDEFNQNREKDSLTEFSEEKLKEFESPAAEFSSEKSEAGEYTHENRDNSQTEQTTKKKSLFEKLKMMGCMVAAAVAVAAITESVYPDFTILPEPITAWIGSAKATPTPIPVPSQKPGGNQQVGPTQVVPSPTDIAINPGDSDPDNYDVDMNLYDGLDDLARLAEDWPSFYGDEVNPNTNVLASGICEQYLAVRLKDGSLTYLYMDDSKPFGETGSVEGMSYDLETNQLTIENVDIEAVYANMMGLGFGIYFKGVNHIGTIICYGYGWGGSLEIKGTGELYINDDLRHTVGITLDAEQSPSILVFNEASHVEIRGSKAAVAVISTTMTGEYQGIYSNCKMYGGDYKEMLTSDMEDFPSLSGASNYSYSIYNKYGLISKHVLFIYE